MQLKVLSDSAISSSKPPTVDGRGSRTFRSSPGNRGAQSIVDLECAGAIPETFQLPAVMRRQLRACEPKKLSGSDVGEDEISLWEFCDFVIDLNTAAEIFQMTSENIRESLSAAPKNRPPVCMPGQSHQPRLKSGLLREARSESPCAQTRLELVSR